MHKKTTFVLKTSEIMKNAIGFIQQLPLDKKPYMVTISEVKNKRSLDQNALFHMWVQDYSDQTGEMIHDAKNYFKIMFLPSKKTTFHIMRKPSYKKAMELKATIESLKHLDCDAETVQSILDEIKTLIEKSSNEECVKETITINEPQSTKELNVNEFTDFLKQIEIYCVTNGIKLRYPDEYKYII